MHTNHPDDTVSFNIEVRVPIALAGAVADALTGDDADIVLAAETAMRVRVDALDATESIELYPAESTASLRAQLRRAA